MVENFDNTAYLAYLQRLTDALVSVVENDRVGTPRFVRWLDRIDPESSIDDSLSLVVGICNRIFDGEPNRVERSGNSESHGTIHAVWASGSSALISVGRSGAPSRSNEASEPEIMLLGSSGAIYFDGSLVGGKRTVEQVSS
ncbi:MAG: hypothetical protein HOF01_02955 [Chloroflexi bacterium]|jgi:hypothetical protein|nr:hypothetical protein [Chloroflexota bacterium]